MVQFAPDINHTALETTIQALIQQQRQFFNTGQTKDVAFRLAQLKALRRAVTEHQEAVVAALQADLGKPGYEAYITEIGVTKEIDYAIKQLRQWAKPQRVSAPLDFFPSRAKIHPEPLGVVLIIGPWNYPFQLVISPLVGAIAAGNCAILKPSEVAPQTSQVVAELIEKTFDPAYITAIEGGIEVSQAILAEKFDHIFFTGGTAIGRVVMSAAAQHLTPVTLELGGKSPCIVDADVPIADAARRITWGKFINAGQTCIAPDYLLVDRRIKPALLEAIQENLRQFYGDDPKQSPDYARIATTKHCDRLTQLLSSGKVLVGGEVDLETRYIAPTVLDQVSWDDPVMQDEIFGPILPVLEYDTLADAIALINRRPKPLALYIFSRNRQVQQQVLRETSSGNACVNDTILQVGLQTLPFGGVGDSGMGSYHGKASFDTFSHRKSVLYKPFWLDMKFRYAPYQGKLKLLKRLMG